MLPHISVPPIRVYGDLSIGPFSVLAAVSLFVGLELALNRARRTGLDTQTMVDGLLVAVSAGFVVAHWDAWILYHPANVLEDPLVLLQVWNGLSAFGGFVISLALPGV